MAHILAHNVGTGGCGAAQHNKQCHKLLIPEAERHRAGQKGRRQTDCLDEGRRHRGAELFDGLCALKRSADGKQRQRRGERGNIAHGFCHHLGQRERQQRIDRAKDNAQQNRVRHHTAQKLLWIWCTALLRGFQHQNQHCKDVEQRHAAQNHQRCHTRTAVDVLDERHAQHGGAAAVARLHKLTHQRFVPQKTLCPRPDKQDADERGGKAEQHKLRLKLMQNIHTAHIQKQHDRQCNFEAELIRRLAERGRQKAHPPQQIPHHHNKEHRHGGIQAEYQVLHVGCLPSLWCSFYHSRPVFTRAENFAVKA